MCRYLISVALLALALMKNALTIELLANYKYWKSAGEELSYDYSGNSRHGRLYNVMGYNATDRGLMSYSYYEKNLMVYAFPSRSEYTTSFWMLSHALASSRFSLYIKYTSGAFLEYRNRLYSTKTEIYTTKNGVDEPLVNLSVYSGWNLHTISFYIDTVTNGRLYFTQYLNLNETPFYSTFYDTGSTNIQIRYIQMRPFDSNSPKKLILYELWVHTGFLTVLELNYLTSDSICPLSTTCLPSYTIGCGCSTISPCDSRLSCIITTKVECKYGLYDIATSRCIFYCPINSCNLPASLSNGATYTSFAYSCIAGYTKLSDNPPACMSVHCLSYRVINYEYFCDTIEYGYSLDSNGECCVCKSGYTQVSASPLVCVNTSTCSGYTITGANYTCSSCTVGYILNSTGKCILRIDNCSSYSYNGTDWICQTCNVGYSVDSNGNCNLCSVGYTQVASNPFTCGLSIENCNIYTYNGSDWICQTCYVGYLVDSNSRCSLCSVGYTQVASIPFTCALIIDHCSIYTYNSSIWICQTCSVGYSVDSYGNCNLCSAGYTQVASNPFTCSLSIYNCSIFTYNGTDWICQTCNVGYLFDSSGNCTICDEGYTQISSNPVTCALKINNCSVYTYSGTDWICQTCNVGYLFDSNGNCDLCSGGYTQVASNPFTCGLEILNCVNYVKKDQDWVCNLCSIGYKVDPYSKCYECDVGYSMVSTNPFICEIEIYGCTIYNNINNKWICEECGVGYDIRCEGRCCECDIKGGYIEVAQSPIICIKEITNCLEYNYYGTSWGCKKCDEGYDIDSEYKCNKCHAGYIEYSQDPLNCLPEIKNCEIYSMIESVLICSRCNAVSRLCEGKCCECSSGYYSSKFTPEKCSECPSNCSKCKEIEDGLDCTSCYYGYTVVGNRCECDEEDFYYKGDLCVAKPLEASLYNDYNLVIITFSKILRFPIQISDFTLNFHQDLDTRLLKYELLTVEDNKSYSLSFSYSTNINQTFDISIIFYDTISDRQNQRLENKVSYTTLPLKIEGITGRNEYCDSSCSECMLVNGKLGCAVCYDYAYIFEGLCRCYHETVDTSPESCPAKCPEGMKIELESRQCLSCDDCYDGNITNDNQNNNIQEQPVLARKYTESSSSITTASSATVFALGSALGADKMWSLMNTIQIYTYLSLLNIDIPLSLQEVLKSQDSTAKYFNSLKELIRGSSEPVSKSSKLDYESTFLLENTAKPISILVVICTLNLLIYILHYISKGSLKLTFEKILKVFYFNAYLRYFIQLYMDILVPCILQVVSVIIM